MRRLICVMALGWIFFGSSAFAEEKWQRLIDLRGQWKFSIGDNKKWADPNYNDSDWESIYAPKKWEDQGFNGFNGFAWYRKAFDGTLLKDENINYHLFAGYIDDADEVYLNGHLIGASGSMPPRYHTAFNAKRNYLLPREFINFKGKNIIAIRVYDAEIEGGIVAGDLGIYVNETDRVLLLNLQGMWDFATDERTRGSFQKGFPAPGSKSNPPAGLSWKKIMVPSLWEHQGFDNYDGTAWYKKQFFVPKSFEGLDLVLVLGKVDDHDETYINGNLVGSTSKHDHFRVYYLTPEMINPGAWNLIVVFVSDTGGFGGIYEGPVGLMKQTEFTRYMRWKN